MENFISKFQKQVIKLINIINTCFYIISYKKEKRDFNTIYL